MELRLNGDNVKAPIEINYTSRGSSRGRGRGGDRNGTAYERPKVQCSHCNRNYHTAEKCWLVHPELKITINQINSVDSYLQSCWLLDSGSQINITGCLNNLTNIKNESVAISMADGNITHTTHKGDFELIYNHSKLLIKDVYYKEGFKNILSVSKLITCGFDVVFDKNNAFIKSKENEKIKLEKFCGMWYIGGATECNSLSQTDDIRKNFEIMHSRLGHPNEEISLDLKFVKKSPF